IIFSDNKNKIDFKFFNQVGISAPMLCFQKDKNNSYFLRLLTSFLENNDIKSSGSNKIYESLVSIKIN
ncbi:hypothetical protein OAB08_04110, partial [Candidatus Pelagibacter ubique]|nr:hypothetical protein [Candidatus Pelagibacter ubique]